MNLPYVYDYEGQHSVTFTVDGVSKNTWTDWGLIPSSRHSLPVNTVWSNYVNVSGTNGQENLVRIYSTNDVNSYSKLRSDIRNDNRDKILTDRGYDIFQPVNGSLSFIIADQEESFFAKQQKIVNYMHGRMASMVFTDKPETTYTILATVDSFSSADHFSNLTISYSVLGVT